MPATLFAFSIPEIRAKLYTLRLFPRGIEFWEGAGTWDDGLRIRSALGNPQEQEKRVIEFMGLILSPEKQHPFANTRKFRADVRFLDESAFTVDIR